MRHYRTLVVVILLFGVLRIALTWRIFSQTVDEPIHVASGYQWLTSSSYDDAEHPPLARVLCAIGPWLHDPHPPAGAGWGEEGNVLFARGSYVANLASA